MTPKGGLNTQIENHCCSRKEGKVAQAHIPSPPRPNAGAHAFFFLPSTNPYSRLFPRKWKLHKQGRGYSRLSGPVPCHSSTSKPFQQWQCKEKLYTTHLHIWTHVHTCLHTDVTQGPVHTGHTETNFWGKSDQPDTCARKENSVSCSSRTRRNL